MKILSDKEFQGYKDLIESHRREIEELRLIKQKYELLQEDLKENGFEYKFIEHQSGRDIEGIWDYDVYIAERGIHLAEVLKDISENDEEDEELNPINLEININLDGETLYKSLKNIKK